MSNLEGTKFTSQLLISSELHAGGLLFGIMYQNYFSFEENGIVRFTKKVVDPTLAMDEFDIEVINNFNAEGKYHVNDKGYLECHFEKINLQLTCYLLSETSMVIHFYSDSLEQEWGEVYQLIS